MTFHPIKISAFEEACDLYMGWCKHCKDFTTDCVEPDASNYECVNCGKEDVVGAENALIAGEISFLDEKDRS